MGNTKGFIYLASPYVAAYTAINGYISGSTVYVIYDADEGTFSDGVNMKSFAVRKGIAWNRRNAREMPDADPTPIEDQMQFDKWYYNGHLIEDSFNLSSWNGGSFVALIMLLIIAISSYHLLTFIIN